MLYLFFLFFFTELLYYDRLFLLISFLLPFPYFHPGANMRIYCILLIIIVYF